MYNPAAIRNKPIFIFHLTTGRITTVVKYDRVDQVG